MLDEMPNPLAGSTEELGTKLEHWLDLFILNIPNLVLAVLVFGAAYYLAGVIRRALERQLAHRIEDASLRSLIATTASIATMAMGLFAALTVLDLETTIRSLLAGAGVAGLAIGLALQSSLANTFAGVYLAVRNVLRVGDWVETNGYKGFVHEVSLRNTILRENDNNLVVIPNRLILDNPFKNYGLTDQVRVILRCGVSYDIDLQEVETLAKDSIREHFPNDSDKEIELHYLEFGSSSIDFQLRFWVDAKARLNVLEAKSEAIKTLKKAFDDHQVVIPYPIRTLHWTQS